MRLRLLLTVRMAALAILAIAGHLPDESCAKAQSQLKTYGVALQVDVLNNVQVAEVDIDYRFRAQESGLVKSLQWYDAYKGGGGDTLTCDHYGCGTGGSVDICIYRDGGQPDHLWTGSPLACVTDSHLRSGDKLRTEILPLAPRLIGGNLYHLHWHNTDADPAHNYVSVNDICVWHPTHPRQPTIPDTDLAVLSGTRVVETDTPIFQLNYADGTTQGQGYKESWIYASERISGGGKVRELIHVTGANRIVRSVSVRLNRASGSGPLTVVLAKSTGEIIEQGTVSSSSFPLGDALTKDSYASKNANSAWGTFTFSAPHVLETGQEYELILSAPADTVYQAYAVQRASAYGYTSATFFDDGHGEFSHDNGLTWSGFRQTEMGRPHEDADIQFYFTLQ